MMRSIGVLFILCLIGMACQQPKPAAEKKVVIDPKILVSCNGIGPVNLSFSYNDLEKKFGAGALSEHENTLAGKFTSVWEGSPKQVNIFWKEKAKPFIHINYMSCAADDSPYKTASGIYVGIPIRDLQYINNNLPITFYNPYSDEGGAIISFNKGPVTKTDPCLGGQLAISKQQNLLISELSDFQKEKIIDTSHKLLAERLDMTLESIRISNK